MTAAFGRKVKSKSKSGSKSGFNFKLKLKKLNKGGAKPRMINDWVLGETLGMGGYSKVKLGINQHTGQKCALKIMLADSTGKISDSKKKQLVRELNVMKKVHHRNVIQLIEFDENAQYPESDGSKTNCILTVLEFASGGELFDYLMFTGCFDEMATRAYFHQMIDGLEAMHRIGIAHRDLKPENLLIDENYVLKIADFGFATHFVDESGKTQKMKTACGTKGYLAPELLKGKKYTHKCDIFALGIILFTTFAGFPPFQNAVETDWWWDKLSKGWKYIAASEKQKTKKDRDKHIAAGNAKIELFWKAHERTRQFPADLKNLLERMLHPYAEYRYDIKHIREHQWYNQRIYTDKELSHYLQRRVRTVVRERAQKIKKQLEEQGVTSVDYVRRRITEVQANTNNLPLTLTPLELRAKEIDPNNEFNKYIDHVRDDLFVNTLFQFFSYAPPAEIAARVERVADRVHAKTTIAPKSNITLVRCAVAFDDEAGEEDVIFAVKQFLIDDNDYVSEEVTAEDEEEIDEEEEEAEQENINDENSNSNSINIEEAVQVKRYLVSFKRLKGSHMAYTRAVEDFYSAPEIARAMDFGAVLDGQ
jgi:serine/threonine protein kinase